MTTATNGMEQAIRAEDRRYGQDELGFVPLDELWIGGLAMQPNRLPKGLVHRPELGIVVPDVVEPASLHAWPAPASFAECPRAITTPGGDFLVMYAAGGGHQIGNKVKVNDLYVLRSSDRGRSWSAREVAWPVPYNQHSANFLVPPGGKRMYSFQMEASFEYLNERHQAPLGMRHSDDDGRTWSDPTFIRPTNDPDYKGVCHMQATIMDSGTWLLPTYTPLFDAEFQRHDRQYVLCSEDEGVTWTLAPGPRPAGWIVTGSERLMEGQLLSLGGPNAVLYTRESSGHLWEQRSSDDGRTWTDPAAVPDLVHCDAPPMVYKLANRTTLITFVHNRIATQSNLRKNDGLADRQELWVSLSTDVGRSWSEPRFFAADAVRSAGQRDWIEISYGDLIADGDTLHFFADHKKRQILHFKLALADIERLPTQAQLATALAAGR